MGNNLVKNNPSLVVVKQKSEDTIWEIMRKEATMAANDEPALGSMLHGIILNHRTINQALAYQIAQKLGGYDLNTLQIREVCAEAYIKSPDLIEKAQNDMDAVMERDPACHSYLQPFLFFKGFLALQAYRIAHYLWNNGRQLLALHMQSRVSELFQVDIHPAARIGKGVFIDHATGIVIGETAVVGDNVSMLHDVTLGGTGKESGDRHPKIGKGVLIGAGAKVLGNIIIGENARIAAGSLVLKPVEKGATVAGIPAIVVKAKSTECSATNMDHVFDCPECENNGIDI